MMGEAGLVLVLKVVEEFSQIVDGNGLGISVQDGGGGKIGWVEVEFKKTVDGNGFGTSVHDGGGGKIG